LSKLAIFFVLPSARIFHGHICASLRIEMSRINRLTVASDSRIAQRFARRPHTLNRIARGCLRLPTRSAIPFGRGSSYLGNCLETWRMFEQIAILHRFCTPDPGPSAGFVINLAASSVVRDSTRPRARPPWRSTVSAIYSFLRRSVACSCWSANLSHTSAISSNAERSEFEAPKRGLSIPGSQERS
jgi:hypothetical protein